MAVQFNNTTGLDNNTSLQQHDLSTKDGRINIFANTAVFVISLLTVATNLLIIAVLFKSKHLRTKMYIVLVVMKCFCDLFVGMTGLSIAVTYYIHFKSDSIPLFCLNLYFLINGISSSLSQTFIICLNRYLSISFRRYNDLFFSGKRKYVVSISSWVLVHINSSWYIIASTNKNNIIACSNSSVFSEKNRAVYLPLAFLYVILFIFIILFYTLSIFQIRKKLLKVGLTITLSTSNDTAESSANSTGNNNCAINRNHKHAIRVTRTVGLIIIILVLFTGPYVIAVIVGCFTGSISVQFRGIFMFAALINSLIGPFIYTWGFKELRQELKKWCNIF